MPIFDYRCIDCGEQMEILVTASIDRPACRNCGGIRLEKMISKPSSFSGKSVTGFPGPGDTSCCGFPPADAGCAGPGSCCGR